MSIGSLPVESRPFLFVSPCPIYAKSTPPTLKSLSKYYSKRWGAGGQNHPRPPPPKGRKIMYFGQNHSFGSNEQLCQAACLHHNLRFFSQILNVPRQLYRIYTIPQYWYTGVRRIFSQQL